jgi:multicomponent K+:H+ antiporter subunit G
VSAPTWNLPLDLLVELLVAALIVIGALFTALGSFGLLRLRDFYSRLHSPTKATTLGVGSLLIASSIYFSRLRDGLSLHEVLVAVFLFITAPVGAHLMAKAALHLRVRGETGLPPDDLLDGTDVETLDPSAGEVDSKRS